MKYIESNFPRTFAFVEGLGIKREIYAPTTRQIADLILTEHGIDATKAGSKAEKWAVVTATQLSGASTKERVYTVLRAEIRKNYDLCKVVAVNNISAIKAKVNGNFGQLLRTHHLLASAYNSAKFLYDGEPSNAAISYSVHSSTINFEDGSHHTGGSVQAKVKFVNASTFTIAFSVASHHERVKKNRPVSSQARKITGTIEALLTAFGLKYDSRGTLGYVHSSLSHQELVWIDVDTQSNVEVHAPKAPPVTSAASVIIALNEAIASEETRITDLKTSLSAAEARLAVMKNDLIIAQKFVKVEEQWI